MSNAKLYAAVKDSLTHEVWRNQFGEAWTQCDMLVVSATGMVRPEWKVSRPGEPWMTSWYCRVCLSSR